MRSSSAPIDRPGRASSSGGVARRTAPLLLARLAGAGTTLIVVAVVARRLGAIEVGSVALGLTAGTLLGALSDLGMTAWMVREIARWPERAGRYLTVVLGLRAILLPVMSLVATILVLRAFPAVASGIIVVTLTVAVQQIAETARSVFVARGSMILAARDELRRMSSGCVWWLQASMAALVASPHSAWVCWSWLCRR